MADQYVIVDLEAASKEDMLKLKERITDKLYKFIVAENYEAVFSVSVGVIAAATFYEGVEECRRKFEFALKQAKSMGKNGFYFFNEKDYEAFQRKGRIIAALRNSIVNGCNGFEVYYQPIYSLERQKFVALEALSRLNHPKFGMIPPDVFIRIAENTGQINALSSLQFRRICRFMKAHPKLREKLLSVKFNLSPAQFLKKGYCHSLIDYRDGGNRI